MIRLREGVRAFRAWIDEGSLTARYVERALPFSVVAIAVYFAARALDIEFAILMLPFSMVGFYWLGTLYAKDRQRKRRRSHGDCDGREL